MSGDGIMVYKYLATLGVENQDTPFRVGLGLMVVGLILPPHFFKLNIASPPSPPPPKQKELHKWCIKAMVIFSSINAFSKEYAASILKGSLKVKKEKSIRIF